MHTSIKEFSTYLNLVAYYALKMTSTNTSKIEIFTNRLKFNISNNVLMGDKPL